MSEVDQKQVPTNGGIGTLPIDPGAEPLQQLPATVSGQDETEFFRRAGAQERLLHNEQNLGLLGKFFGSNGSNAPASTNIAGLVVCASFIFLGASWFVPSTPELVELRKLLIGLISTALAFIFGAASRK
ncbi:MAG: hypothetical protein AB9M53_07505 [Leptothrix sp. (in: b-proteobacteria)]